MYGYVARLEHDLGLLHTTSMDGTLENEFKLLVTFYSMSMSIH